MSILKCRSEQSAYRWVSYTIAGEPWLLALLDDEPRLDPDPLHRREISPTVGTAPANPCRRASRRPLSVSRLIPLGESDVTRDDLGDRRVGPAGRGRSAAVDEPFGKAPLLLRTSGPPQGSSSVRHAHGLYEIEGEIGEPMFWHRVFDDFAEVVEALRTARWPLVRSRGD